MHRLSEAEVLHHLFTVWVLKVSIKKPLASTCNASHMFVISQTTLKHLKLRYISSYEASSLLFTFVLFFLNILWYITRLNHHQVTN